MLEQFWILCPDPLRSFASGLLRECKRPLSHIGPRNEEWIIVVLVVSSIGVSLHRARQSLKQSTLHTPHPALIIVNHTCDAIYTVFYRI